MIGHLAYWSDLDSKSTFGANLRTGKIEFRRRGGAYNPVVSDGKTIYLTGYNSITALQQVRWGVITARRAWLRPEDVLNTRPYDELRSLLRRNRVYTAMINFAGHGAWGSRSTTPARVATS